MEIPHEVKENVKALDDLMNTSQSNIDIAISAMDAINTQTCEQFMKFGLRESILPKWLGGNTPARQRVDELTKRETDYQALLNTQTSLIQATNRQVREVITDYLESSGDIVYKTLDNVLRDLEPARKATGHYMTFVQSAVNERNGAEFKFVADTTVDEAIAYFKIAGYSMPAEAVQQSTRKFVNKLKDYEWSLDEHTQSAAYLTFNKTIDFNLDYLTKSDYEELAIRREELNKLTLQDTVVVQESIGKTHEDALTVSSILNKHYLSALGNMTAYVGRALEEARK